MKLTRLFRRFVLRQALPTDKKELREFIYLDEVSLRSLLSSQTGEMTDSKSEQNQANWTIESSILSSLGTDTGGKVQGNSRFQTGNSSAVQTSRKATVQSWFRELHGMHALRLVSQVKNVRPFRKTKHVWKSKNTSITASSDMLVRGKLIEMRVELTADPIFRMGTMVHEFGAMAGEVPPEMLKGVAGLSEAAIWNKVLDRFLAGLIPIRSLAIDHVVVELNGKEYVVHKEALTKLDLPSRPLYVTGVTEHVAYWKDIRRVLFSGSTFTIMGRVARDGLHDSWSPVKLTELFESVAPDLSAQMADAAKFIQPQGRPATPIQSDHHMISALRSYKHALLVHKGKVLTAEQDARVERAIEAHSNSNNTVELQRSAFEAVRREVQSVARIRIRPDVDISLREEARGKSGLTYFPQTQKAVNIVTYPEMSDRPERILDVEVVAIYW
ncbi:DUF6414 family protein [Rhizobium skierniewicense]|uniref:DUF6414 family protein n=1 Tax=Rhizobium skierniewicense TaxID=984260 RepID=UPI0015725B14|nr:hypothetical protein [Rhizobium skierniewicense]NTF34134.1 hypothetical protein [Rhizobium skierniewicense]